MSRSAIDIPAALRRLRDERGLTQDQLGERMRPKRHGSGVHKIETRNPTARVIADYLQGLDATLADLARVQQEAIDQPAQQSPGLALAYLERELEYWMTQSPEGRARLASLRR